VRVVVETGWRWDVCERRDTHAVSWRPR